MGQAVVVVGGGRVAVRKVDLLRRSGAQVTVVAPELREELHKLAASGAIQHIAAKFAAEHLDREAAVLVIAATDDHEVNVAVSEAARARRIPVNVVDDPALSTFIFPAIVDRSPIIVAVSSGGESPVLARRVRERHAGEGRTAGRSSRRTRPPRIHPARRSHVCGVATGGASRGLGNASAQPANHRAEEHGSMPPRASVPRSGMGSGCFSKFFST